jgi:riboflavin kinase
MDQSSSSGNPQLLRRIAIESKRDPDGRVTAEDLASHLGTSVKSIRSSVEAAERHNLVRVDGDKLFLTTGGRRQLYETYLEYRSALDMSDRLELTGHVTSGLGKGREFVTLDGYQKQFVDKLAYKPFPGTFNICLTDPSAKKRSALSEFSKIRINGWERSDSSFGPVSCYPASVFTAQGTHCHQAHVIVPDRTEHSVRELELLAPFSLRDHLVIKEGDRVNVSIDPSAINPTE